MSIVETTGRDPNIKVTSDAYRRISSDGRVLACRLMVSAFAEGDASATGTFELTGDAKGYTARYR